MYTYTEALSSFSKAFQDWGYYAGLIVAPFIIMQYSKWNEWGAWGIK